jgi:hypothetical protein
VVHESRAPAPSKPQGEVEPELISLTNTGNRTVATDEGHGPEMLLLLGARIALCLGGVSADWTFMRGDRASACSTTVVES